MSEEQQRELHELVRDIHEDLRGDKKRNIKGLIHEVKEMRSEMQAHHRRIKDVERFVNAVTGLPGRIRWVVSILGVIVGLSVGVMTFWEKLISFFR